MRSGSSWLGVALHPLPHHANIYFMFRPCKYQPHFPSAFPQIPSRHVSTWSHYGKDISRDPGFCSMPPSHVIPLDPTPLSIPFNVFLLRTSPVVFRATLLYKLPFKLSNYYYYYRLFLFFLTSLFSSQCHGLLLPLMYLPITTPTTFHLPPMIPHTTDSPVLDLGRAAVAAAPMVPPAVGDTLAPGILLTGTPASPWKNPKTATLSTSTRTSRSRWRRVGRTCLRR